MSFNSIQFSFNLADIPTGPVTYPPGLVLEPPANEEHQDSENSKLTELYKKSHSLDSSFKAPKKIKKAIRWSAYDSARLITNDQTIDEAIPASKVFHFFKKHSAIARDKPGGDTDPVSVWSRDPEDVPEIADARQLSVRKMNDATLLNNYKRLLNKQKHIFSQQRSTSFQKSVMRYLDDYKLEIDYRRLAIT